ncbi:MAG TPA: hypothetical protein VN416_00995 [Desulfomonilia bacterium]|nr:hypothetical protein [Desulfomonilia bacterium]
MELGILAGILIVGFFVIFLLFFAPKSDLVFTSASDDEIRGLKHFLEDNGIEVYIKGMDMRNLHETAHDLVNPTLHVVRPEDRAKALELIRTIAENHTPPSIGPY